MTNLSFTPIKTLGEGTYGEVSLALMTREGEDTTAAEQRVAIKTPKKKQGIRALNEEIAFLKAFDHPNIVQLIATIQDDSGITRLVLEYIPGQPVYECKQFKGQVAVVGNIAHGLLSALEYLRSRNVIHRDLSYTNVVIAQDRAKIIDFGSAVQLGSGKKKGDTGTYHMRPPEMFLQGEEGPPRDMWAIALIIFRLYSTKTLIAWAHVEFPSLYLNQFQAVLGPLSDNEKKLYNTSIVSQYFGYTGYLKKSPRPIGDPLAMRATNMKRLLRQMLTWTPKGRITPTEAMQYVETEILAKAAASAGSAGAAARPRSTKVATQKKAASLNK